MAMMRPEQILSLYSAELDKAGYESDADCPSVHVFGPKFPQSGEPACGTLLLADLLKERWESLAWYAQYTSQSGVRLAKDEPFPSGIRFDIACFTLNFNVPSDLWGPRGGRPHDDDFASLVRLASTVGYAPNIVYETLCGAQFLYLIETTADPRIFEARTQALRQQVAAGFGIHGGPFQVDLRDNNWASLFLPPHVPRFTPYGGPSTRLLHRRRLNLLSVSAGAGICAAWRFSQAQWMALDFVMAQFPVVANGQDATTAKKNVARVLLRQFALPVREAGQVLSAWLRATGQPKTNRGAKDGEYA
jgi:hypothetical protein